MIKVVWMRWIKIKERSCWENYIKLVFNQQDRKLRLDGYNNNT